MDEKDIFKKVNNDASEKSAAFTSCVENSGGEGGKRYEITVDAKIEKVDEVIDFVSDKLLEVKCPKKAMTQILVAVDEIFGNIARYAYEGVGQASVCLDVIDNPQSVVLTFTDAGKPYDPLKQKEPDTGLSLEEREIGGLGIFIVKKTMDEMTYEYKDGKNVLRLKKVLKED